MLAHGAVTGLARTLARYHVWLRILGVALLLTAALLLAALGWQCWIIARENIDRLASDYAVFKPFETETWLLWLALAVQAILLLLDGIAGWMLLRAAARVKRAAESGSEPVLALALQDTGRYFILTVAVVVLSLAFTLGSVIYLGWDKAFPPESPPAEKPVAV
jgi:hypothetical protein